MNENIENRIIAFFEGELSEKEAQELSNARLESAEAESLYLTYDRLYRQLSVQEVEQPTVKMQTNFDRLLEEEKSRLRNATVHSIRSPKRSRIFIYSAAASVLLLIGLALGIIVSNRYSMQGMNQDMANLQREMQNLLHDESVSVRIKAVNMTYEIEKPDAKILRALFDAMHRDPSENVRSAAVTALAKFAQEEEVKTELIKALEEQQAPYLQIKIIKILSTIKAKDAINSFDHLIDNQETSRNVKIEAQQGKEKLLSL